MQDQETKTQGHACAALRLLEDADREVAKCNIGETSEKLWEAASNAIKAVCVRRGWLRQVGDVAVCVPNRLVVRVEGAGGPSFDGVSR